MKILVTGDWHLRYKKPVKRIDESYFEEQARKVRQILAFAHDNKCNCILQPGDFFDSVETPYSVIQYYVNLLYDFDIPIFCVRGQHDLRYHSSNTDNTPLAVMEAAGVVQIVDTFVSLFDEVELYGCSWEGLIPRVSRNDKLKILLIHKMIVNEKIWEGQTNFVYGNKFLEKHKGFDLIISGDNHEHFVFGRASDSRMLLNCGSLMRSRIDQVDHKPVVYVYDTETRQETAHYLDVKSPEKVFDFNKKHEEDEITKELELFINRMDNHSRKRGSESFDFIERIEYQIKEMELDDYTAAVVKECLSD